MRFIKCFLPLMILVLSCDSSYIGRRSFSIGDTVIVHIIAHGNYPGVVMKKFDGDYYIRFLGGCNCNNWYDNYDIHPYSYGWDK